ncbi:hypothetical protein [Chroococcidiopsis sp. SAG 2025]|uniref:hypothetical protein n=1 Tax=Chroococcidiopsis sp. SAG 2025 TaxID=171389 RepID=UPI002936DB75|nr:hypothetical protein [Chroococcidiopsis sp. SAG 2025]
MTKLNCDRHDWYKCKRTLSVKITSKLEECFSHAAKYKVCVYVCVRLAEIFLINAIASNITETIEKA